jgi:glutamate dehydrogenase (NADP+)
MDLKNVRRGRIKEYIQQFKGAKFLAGQRPWAVQCELAFPSATQNELDGPDARNLVQNGCICVSEGANMPSTPEAIEVFMENKTLYGPGKAANAGGVAVSGLEMTQNAGCMRRSRNDVDSALQGIMKSIHANCVRYGQVGGDAGCCKPKGFVNYLNGANIAGFIKVADAMVQQGVL